MVFVMMLMTMVAVMARYVFNSPLPAIDEIGGYLLVAIIFLGLAYSWREKAHIRIQFVVNRLPARVRTRLRLITLFIALAFVPFLIKATYELIAYSHKQGRMSSFSLRIPLEWPEIPMLIGVVLLFLAIVIDVARNVIEYWTTKGKGS